MTVQEDSLNLHEKLKGKLSISSKVSLATREDFALAYTPGVAEPSKRIAEDKELAYRYTLKGNTVAVISNGTAVLGLGDIGPYGAIPVMEGKAAIFKELAGIDAFPICIDSKDVQENINIIKKIAPVFGGINLEDYRAPECFEIESALQDLGIPVMHDDQHGTAMVVLAGLINSLKVTKKKKEDVRIVINGAGSAGIAITKLLLAYGFKHITLHDTRGAIYRGRKDLNRHKEEIANLTNLACHEGIKKKYCSTGNLEDSLKESDIFIGVSKANLLNEEMIKSMNKGPIIFALANPIPEIMPDIAKKAGASIVATGRSDFPNQVNNALIFPGIFRGALDIRANRITEKMKIAAAEALAGMIISPTEDNILPSITDKEVPKKISEAVKKT